MFEKIVNENKQITTITVEWEAGFSEIMSVLKNFFDDNTTDHLLLDLRYCSFDAITHDHIRDLCEYASFRADGKNGGNGKTALISSNDLQFEIGVIFKKYSEMIESDIKFLPREYSYFNLYCNTFWTRENENTYYITEKDRILIVLKREITSEKKNMKKANKNSKKVADEDDINIYDEIVRIIKEKEFQEQLDAFLLVTKSKKAIRKMNDYLEQVSGQIEIKVYKEEGKEIKGEYVCTTDAFRVLKERFGG